MVDIKEKGKSLDSAPITGHMQAISGTYHRILRVDLLRDRYDVVKMNPEDKIGRASCRERVFRAV